MTLCIVLEWLLLLPHSHAAEGSRELPWYLICCYENSEFHCSKNSFFPSSYQNPIVVLLLVDLFDGFVIIMIFPALLSWICLIYTVSGIQKGEKQPISGRSSSKWRSLKKYFFQMELWWEEQNFPCFKLFVYGQNKYRVHFQPHCHAVTTQAIPL